MLRRGKIYLHGNQANGTSRHQPAFLLRPAAASVILLVSVPQSGRPKSRSSYSKPFEPFRVVLNWQCSWLSPFEVRSKQ